MMENSVHNKGVGGQKGRQWIYAKKPSGKLYNYRQVVGYTLLLFLFVAPFLKINGNPFLMFNILERKFSIFGQIFYPQDLHIFVFAMLIGMVCIVLFTVVYGRVWCGWTCPQTIFMELIFRKIEYLIEGDWIQQKRVNEGPDTDSRAWKKLAKHSIFLVISFLISNLFLAYIIGVDSLFKIISEPVAEHSLGFIAIAIFTLVFYGVFAHVREIVCTTICPYGRLQSVLLDENSITVAYNQSRGEPRGKLKKEMSADSGDCVDCKLCVQVCPTGIDIRNGLQMECISCTACIDVCDGVMEKIGKPKRLIGFYSANADSEHTSPAKSKIKPIAYSVVLILLLLGLSFMIFSRSDIDGRLLRAKGTTYQFTDDGMVSNLYTLELINKSGKKIGFNIESEDREYTIKRINQIDSLAKDGKSTLSFFVYTNKEHIKEYKTNIQVNITSEGKLIERMKTTFISPPSSL